MKIRSSEQRETPYRLRMRQVHELSHSDDSMPKRNGKYDKCRHARELTRRSAIEINFESGVRKNLDCREFGVAIVLIIGVILPPSTHLRWLL